MKYPNRIQAALLLDARFEELDALARDFARIAEMKSGATFNVPEHHPGAFVRMFGGSDDLMLTFEYIDSPPNTSLFASALASPVTSIRSPDMPDRIGRARSHILLEVSHGAMGGVEEDPKIAPMMHDVGISGSSTNAAAFERRLEALALMARVATDHVTPSAIHWTQSNQLLEPDAFEAMAARGFPGPLAIHPLLFGDDKPAEAGAQIGLRTFGARHWLGREIVVPPTSLPWSAAYQTVLVFCAMATMEDGYIIPDGDTFGPPPPEGEEPGEVWRVQHHDLDQDAPANDDTDARGGPVPVYELVPLRHDECNFVAEEYAREASVLCTREPKPKPAPKAEDAADGGDAAGDASLKEEASSLAELEAALAEGRAEAAANPPDPLPATLTSATPSLAGDQNVSGRSLRAKVFGKKES